jgi:hypothetical protein
VTVLGDTSVRQLPPKVAAALAIEHHYMHRRPAISWAFGLVVGDPLMSNDVVGVVTFGCPASRHLQVGACRSNPDAVIELNRLWVSDDMPRNTESFFVAQTLRRLPPLIVVSYADSAHGHVGYVYRALSWRFAGLTDADRKTPRWDYIPHDPTMHTREATRSGVADRVRRRPKYRYWTTTGTPAERRRLAKACTWPDIPWAS